MYRLEFLSSLLGALLLSGCALITALTYIEEDKSGILAEQEVYLRGIHLAPSQTPTTSFPGQYNQLPNSDIIFHCMNMVQFDPALAIPVARAGVAIFFDQATQAIEGYINAQKRRLTKSYAGRINYPKFHLPSVDQDDFEMRCLDIVRIVEHQGRKQLAMRAILYIEPHTVETVARKSLKAIPIGEPLVYVIKPIYLEFNYAAALTESGKGVKVELEVTVDIPFISAGNVLATITRPVQRKFIFPNLKPGTILSGPKLENKFDSTIIHWPSRRPTAATVAVNVTETGSGSDKFDSALPDVKSTGKTLSDTVKDIVKEALAE